MFLRKNFFFAIMLPSLDSTFVIRCSEEIMKFTFALAVFLVINANGFCRESDFEAYKHDDVSNLTTEDDLLSHFMKSQRFTAGTLLGLLVATVVVVIGSFLVLWRLCCDVEMYVTKEVTEPLNSISQSVSSKKISRTAGNKSVSTQSLLGHRCSSSVLEIA